LGGLVHAVDLVYAGPGCSSDEPVAAAPPESAICLGEDAVDVVEDAPFAAFAARADEEAGAGRPVAGAARLARRGAVFAGVAGVGGGPGVVGAGVQGVPLLGLGVAAPRRLWWAGGAQA